MPVPPNSLPAHDLVRQPRVLVIAHRGNSSVAPENTLPAFQSAIEAGADLVELDYFETANGQAVAFHDDVLDRTTDAVKLWGGKNIAVGRHSLAELKQLDVGRWFGRKFSETRIPTLAEALAAITPRSIALIERKTGSAVDCVDLLAQSGWIDRSIVQSFDWEFLAECRSLSPDLVLAALGDREFSSEKWIHLPDTGAAVVGWDERGLSADAIAMIHDRGYKAWAWTVDQPRRIETLIGWGIDGIITNQPANIRRRLGEGRSDSS